MSKLQIVCDASDRGNGPSLMTVCPEFEQNIVEILLRSCIHNSALADDIEKAFLMVATCCFRRQERLEISVG